MRVAIAAFSLESVSFLSRLVEIEDFKRTERTGADLLTAFRGTNTVIGGFIKVLEAESVEAVPILSASAGAAGPASDKAFVHYVDRICAGLQEAGKLDGVLLHPHGAMTTPTRLDPDREMVERVRAVIGRHVPLLVALDYHANIDAQWLSLADAIFGYHYSPHVDTGTTGERAARCLVRMLRDGVKPAMAVARPRVMVPSIFSATSIPPLSDIVADSVALPDRQPGVIDASVFAGFSYADVPNCGFSVIVVADGDPGLARREAERLSAWVRREREALMHRDLVYGLDAGMDRAIAIAATATKPVVLLEHADRLNDSTYVLREVLRRGLKRVAVPYLWDPIAAAQAVAAGAGAEVALKVGSRSSERAGGPVELRGRVIWAGEKEYRTTGTVGHGDLVRLGPSAVIDADGVVVILTSAYKTAIDLDPFLQFDQRIENFDIVVLRSKTHFRDAYEPVAQQILIVDTPDWGPADLTTLPYRQVPIEDTYPFSEGEDR